MEGAHFHLLVNHIPIVGVIFGMLILLTGIVLKNGTVKQTGLGTLMVAALSVIFALLSGDPAGESVKGLPGVTGGSQVWFRQAAGMGPAGLHWFSGIA